MALTTTDKTFGQKTVSVVEVDTDQFILEGGLSKFDAEQLEEALKETSLSDYTIPTTGVTADVYFAPFIHTEAELTRIYAEDRVVFDGVNTILEMEAKLADLETRVAALESAS